MEHFQGIDIASFGRKLIMSYIQQYSERQKVFVVEHAHFNVTYPDISEIASVIDSLKANKALGAENI